MVVKIVSRVEACSSLTWATGGVRNHSFESSILPSAARVFVLMGALLLVGNSPFREGAGRRSPTQYD